MNQRVGEETMTTVTYQSFSMEMTADTTDAEIRQFVEYSSQYEFDREDISEEEVQATIDATVDGLIAARDQEFGQIFNIYRERIEFTDEDGNPSSGWRIGSDVVLSAEFMAEMYPERKLEWIAVLACDPKAAMEKAEAIWFPHRHE